MRYLNPKADLTFKRVFGEHPDLVMSFLNVLLPLEAGEEITEVEYLPSEMVPEKPWRKTASWMCVAKTSGAANILLRYK